MKPVYTHCASYNAIAILFLTLVIRWQNHTWYCNGTSANLSNKNLVVSKRNTESYRYENQLEYVFSLTACRFSKLRFGWAQEKVDQSLLPMMKHLTQRTVSSLCMIFNFVYL